ncbi:MAG: hypothetical protein CME65_13730 [Halobacteriovoraceae bacterium]|nr:hypothetical protein [Halobacteriovoraceae bacterium]|tara:strand:- start:9455 stop:10099 length:645 start_codon:yes stop_codon:yes gene_type:complete
MKFSNKILERKLVYPQIQYNLKHALTYEHQFDILKTKLDIIYQVDFENLKIHGIRGEIEPPYHKILDGLLELVDGQKIGSLNRISSKELDYFFRDEKSVPAVTFYSSEYLDLFGLMSGLYKNITGIQSKALTPDLDYFDRSFSEQVEFFEEILAQEIYPYREWTEFNFDLDDIKDLKMFILVDRVLSESKKDEFQKILKRFIPKLYDIELLIDL